MALKASCRAYDGLGLAAPQLGYDKRAFALLAPRPWMEEKSRAIGNFRFKRRSFVPMYVACVNPQILSRSEESVVGMESCLSVPDEIVLVQRSQRITVSYENEKGDKEERELSGLPAVVFQHELDHLDGVLHIDKRFSPTAEDDFEAYKRASRDFKEGIERYYEKG